MFADDEAIPSHDAQPQRANVQKPATGTGSKGGGASKTKGGAVAGSSREVQSASDSSSPLPETRHRPRAKGAHPLAASAVKPPRSTPRLAPRRGGNGASTAEVIATVLR